MKAGDIMTRKVIGVGPGHNVRHAASIMVENALSGLPVIDDDGQLVGMLTEGDLLRREELGWSPAADSGVIDDEDARAYVRALSWRVSDLMSREVVTVDEDTPTGRICRLMIERGINRLPVMRDGAVVGIVSRSDLLRVVAAGGSAGVAAGDEALCCAVRSRLTSDLGLSGVHVEAKEGYVTLTGSVPSALLQQAARVAAESVPGVSGVVCDRLTVGADASGGTA